MHRSPRVALLLAALLALVAPARAADPSAADVMKRQREVHRLKDEEERQTLKLVNKAGASKERKLVR
jgi:hypothetical protein